MKCFFVCAIGDEDSDIRTHTDTFYFHILKNACEELNIKLYRCDLLNETERLDKTIFDHLTEDDIVVADLSFENMNVALEIGYRLAVKKPLVLVRDKKIKSQIPSDISSLKWHEYDPKPTNESSNIKKLKNIIEDNLKYQPAKKRKFKANGESFEI